MKERLSTLLQKKLSENERKSKEIESKHEAQEDLQKKEASKAKDGGNFSNSEQAEKDNVAIATETNTDYLSTQFLLHEILLEKKKALLQHPEVVAFLRNKIKMDDF